MQFKDVLGQKALKNLLIREVQEDRISHAQLFLGKLGYGGFPMAMAFVQYLFCTNRTAEDSCGVCPSCQKISQMQHPDLHFTFPTVQALAQKSDLQFSEFKAMISEQPFSNLNDWIQHSDPKSGRRPIISVHQSQDILHKLSLKSFEGGYKVSIIWKADEMNEQCANKLLKIIEEPAPKTLFILLVEELESIMPTILSRTQIQHLKPLNDIDLTPLLVQNGITDGELQKSILARSEGDANVAKDLCLGGVRNNQNRSDFIQLMRSCYKKDVLPMMDWAEKMSSYGKEEQKNFMLYALYMIRQSLMKNYTNEQLMKTSHEEADFLKNFARFITNNNVMDFTDLFSKSHYYLERNAHARLLFTNISFEVMRYIHRA